MDDGVTADPAGPKGVKTCSIDSFLKAFLSRCQDAALGTNRSPDELLAVCLQAVRPLGDVEDLRGHFSPYLDGQTPETRSSSFARASNVALQHLSTLPDLPLRPVSELEILFHAGNHRQTFFDLRNMVPSGFKTRHPDMEPARGPDIVITSANAARSVNGLTTDEESKWVDIAFGAALEGGSRKLQWPDVLSSFISRPVESEITTDGRSPDKELLDVQCAISAARSLGRAPCVFHAINVVLLDDIIYIRWFDTQGAIYSSGLNLTTDLPLYFVLLLAFQRFRMEDWGVCPEMDPNAVTAHTSTHRNGSGISQNPLQVNIEGISVTVNLIDGLTALFKDRNPYGGALKVYSARSESELPSTNRSLQRGWLTTKIYWESSDDSNPVDPPDTLCSKRLAYTTRTIREDLGLHSRGQTGSFTPRIVILESIAPALKAGPRNDFMTCWFQAMHGHYAMQKYAQYPINPSPDKFLLRRFQDGRCEGAFADLDRVVTKAHSDRFLDQHERPNMHAFMAVDLLSAYEERTKSARSGESARAAYERMKRTG